MKKFIKFLAITLSAFILFGCPKTSDSLNNQTDSSDTQPESESPDTNHEIKNETFKEISVFNPTENTVKLVAEPKARSLIPESRAAATEICTVKSKEKKEVKIGSEHDYYFTDEVNIKIADLSKADSGDYMPVYLELNEPKAGKQYLLLNQYKNANFLESFSRINEKGERYETYSLKLFEVVQPDDLDAVKYDENTYIRTYPSANYWIDSKGYTSNKLGTIITYNAEFRNNLENISNPWTAWGWSTLNTDYNMYFCHRVVSFVLHAKDGDSYTVKEIVPKINESYWWNTAKINEFQINETDILQNWNSNCYYQLKSIKQYTIPVLEPLLSKIKEDGNLFEGSIVYYLSRLSNTESILIVTKNGTILETFSVEVTTNNQTE